MQRSSGLIFREGVTLPSGKFRTLCFICQHGGPVLYGLVGVRYQDAKGHVVSTSGVLSSYVYVMEAISQRYSQCRGVIIVITSRVGCRGVFLTVYLSGSAS